MKYRHLKYRTITIFLTCILLGSKATSAAPVPVNLLSPESLANNAISNPAMNFKITRLYSGKDGISHFEDFNVKATQPYTSTLIATPTMSAVGFQLLSFPAGFTWGTHNAPTGARFLELVIEGSETITAGDGTSKTLKPGDMILFDDPTGIGHQASGKNGKSLVIKLS